jgi:hypothetical protein
MQVKLIVQSAAKALRQHPLGKLDAVAQTWTSVNWRAAQRNEGLGTTQSDARWIKEEPPAIRLYPSLEWMPEPLAQYAVLREFGGLLLARSGERGRVIWGQKLGLPSRAQVDSVQARLTEPKHRQRIGSYRALVDTYSRALDRLVALNLCNALLANRVPYSDSHGIILCNWGPTQEYAGQRRYHTVACLLPAYCPPALLSNFGNVFAESVLNDMQSVSESSVAQSLRDLVQNVAERAK